MINYNRSAFGVGLLFRIHGSAIYRSVVPALISIGFFIIIRIMHRYDIIDETSAADGEELEHPYAIGVIITGTTFLIVFRASQGYSRYWEAATSVFAMMSKWMDSSVHIAAYHMQSDHYEKIKPPSFYSIPEFDGKFYSRDRERFRDESFIYQTDDHNDILIHTSGESEEFPITDSRRTVQTSNHRRVSSACRAVQRSINAVEVDSRKSRRNSIRSRPSFPPPRRFVSPVSTRDVLNSDGSQPTPLYGCGRLDGNWGSLFNDGTSTFHNPFHDKTLRRQRSNIVSAATYYKEDDDDKRGFASTRGGRTPPLFLQELAHLTSLMNAVALSTLRNDVDGAESPLDLYEPGTAWPTVDPADDHKPTHNGTHSLSLSSMEHIGRVLLFFLGAGRSAEERTLYNASRPLPVIGGVSDSEIKFLQMARGPFAKTQLCWFWLSEFIIREQLAGSLGKVGPPIVSRTFQFLSDGMTAYNHARKIMFIPFPFVHAQLSAAFVLVMIPVIPLLMDQYTTQETLSFGIILTFFAVMCLSGIHEVARELENPFRNVPNELPVVTLQAEFNEGLLTMYAGYHPDLFWETNMNINSNGPTSSSTNGDDDTKSNSSAETDKQLQHISDEFEFLQRISEVEESSSSSCDPCTIVESSPGRPKSQKYLNPLDGQGLFSIDETRQDGQVQQQQCSAQEDPPTTSDSTISSETSMLDPPTTSSDSTMPQQQLASDDVRQQPSSLSDLSMVESSSQTTEAQPSSLPQNEILMEQECQEDLQNDDDDDDEQNLSAGNDSTMQLQRASDDVQQQPQRQTQTQKQYTEKQDGDDPNDVEKLRQIIEQQGKLVERMMEEQIRLNKLVGTVLLATTKQ